MIITNDIFKTAKKLIKKAKIKKILFDPYEFNLAQYIKLTKNISCKFIQKPHFLKHKRAIKCENEIELIKKAMQKTRAGFKDIKKLFSLGIDEIELNYKSKHILTNKGRYQLSFQPITAIDKNSAKPHAKPDNTKYQKKSLVLVDAGIKYKRYCSDRTETFINKKDKLQQKVYDIVQKAQQKVISKLRAGDKASSVDKIARDVIEKAGFGKYFVHSLGHGVGLDIHEYPVLSQKSKDIIQNNMIFSVEPGIYLPGRFGVRIEDCVVVQDGKAVVL